MRKDIFEVIFMEQKNNEKISYASIGRRCNCDPRTVKRYYENRNNSPTTRKKRYKKKVTDDFLETICNKCDVNAPAISIFNFIKKKGYKGGYSSVKTICSKHKEGKTHLATSIGIEATSQRISIYFINFSTLMEKFKSAAKENRIEQVVRHYLKYTLLIIDEIGYLPIDKETAYAFF